MKRTGAAVWTHRDKESYMKNFIDPRIAIAHHINWRRNYTETEFSLPEPDNYNFATMSARPLYCDLVRNQVWYRDEIKLCWVSVFLVANNITDDFKTWLKQQPWTSYWRNGYTPALRTRRPMLWNRQRATELTLEERLYLSGYYKNFIAKYFTDGHAEFVYKRLGGPRGRLIDWEGSQDDTSREESLYDF